MYARILVALDGSELAERILPHVEALAEKLGSAVTLLRAIPSPGIILAEAAPGAVPVAGPVVDVTPLVEAERREAGAYLDAVAERLRARGVTVETEQSEGPAHEVIVARARELSAGLVAMTTHGRGGLSRLFFGSVAEAVLREAPCPVLLLRVGQDHL
jgi:nucleotide-binding universal stress UspA family protein